jgi:hypothetical protein
MLGRIHIPTCLLFGTMAAVVYSIAAMLFLKSGVFADSWWLFAGNFFFMVVVGAFVLRTNYKEKENINTSLSVVSGHLVATIGVVLSCIFAFILLNIHVPNLLSDGPVKVLEQSPAQTQNGRTDGLALLLFMNAIIGNITAGSFASIILPYTMKRNQAKESVISRVRVDTR